MDEFQISLRIDTNISLLKVRSQKECPDACSCAIIPVGRWSAVTKAGEKNEALAASQGAIILQSLFERFEGERGSKP